MKLTTISKALPLIAVAVWMAGCQDTSVAAVQKPVNQADPTGMGLTKEKRQEMINGDPSMTPDQKAAALERLQTGRHIMRRGSTQ